jgi:Fe-S cluster assembly ATP-binding protein
MLLEVQDVSLTLDNQLILDDLNLHVNERDIHSILGVNGVGKSMMAALLMGLHGIRPDKGHIFFAGEDISQTSITERAQRGLTLAWQTPVSFQGLTVRHYLKLSGRQANTDGDIEEGLQMVGLSPSRYLDRYVDDHLSGGERRRIELAAVVIMRPRLAILDEPDSGIDFLSLDEIVDVIQRLNQEGTTVLLITHREEMANMAHRASLMCAGMVIATGEPRDVTAFFREHCDECKNPNLPDLKVVANELRRGI